jgi:hypothetical protein
VSLRFGLLDCWLIIIQGYNIIHIVPNAGLANEAFDFDELDTFLDIMDEIGLWLMFDMRESLMAQKNFDSTLTCLPGWTYKVIS